MPRGLIQSLGALLLIFFVALAIYWVSRWNRRPPRRP
jgi:hypothetical protein